MFTAYLHFVYIAIVTMNASNDEPVGTEKVPGLLKAAINGFVKNGSISFRLLEGLSNLSLAQ